MSEETVATTDQAAETPTDQPGIDAAQNTSPTTRAERETAPRRRTPHKISRAVIEVKVDLRSRYAQQVMKRSYRVGSNALYALAIILRAYASNEEAEAVNKVADSRLDEVRDGLTADMARFDKLAEDNGVDAESVEYTVPTTIKAQINSPRTQRYLQVIRLYDDLVGRMDLLWLCGVYTDSQYYSGVYSWQRRLIRLGNQLRGLAQRSISLARRSDQGDDEAQRQLISELLSGDDDSNDEDPDGSDTEAADQASEDDNANPEADADSDSSGDDDDGNQNGDDES